MIHGWIIMKISGSNPINAPNLDQLSKAKGPAVGSFHGHNVRVAATPAEKPAPHSLHEGSRGSEVRHMQKQLAVLGFRPGPIDGIFGPHTEAALKAFQRSRGLAPDGVFGA